VDDIRLTSPVDGSDIGGWEETSAERVSAAVASGRRAVPEFAALTLGERCDLLVETSKHLGGLSDALVVEHGKTVAEYAAGAAAARLVVGDPFDERFTFGPLHLAQTCSTMADHIADALRRGARLVCGGAPTADAPTDRYWPVTLLRDVPHDALTMRDETFGPIVPMTSFATDDERDALVRASPYGLSAAVFTEDEERAADVARGISSGTVVVNADSNTRETHLPFCGHPGSASGIGRVGIHSSLTELSTTRSFTVNRPASEHETN